MNDTTSPSSSHGRSPEKPQERSREKAQQPKGGLVQDAAEHLRELILACDPGTQIGSLNEVAEQLGVGIVTVQQAARILEHEGLLTVKRGPGGGYYGARPDAAALVRSFASYMRAHGFNYLDTLEMITLLDFDIMPGACECQDLDLREHLRHLGLQLEQCNTAEERAAFEQEFHHTAMNMANRPLIQLLANVTAQLFKNPDRLLFASDDGVAEWRKTRRNLIQAILDHDATRARFETERFRDMVLTRLHT